MIPGFDIESLNKLGKLIAELERFHLEGAIPGDFAVADLLDDEEQSFFAVRGLADFWSESSVVDFAQHMTDLVIGAHNQRQADLTMVMLGTPRELSIFISLGNTDTARAILEGIFPGIILEPVPTSQLVERLRACCLIKGLLTGIPSRNLRNEQGQKIANPQRQQDQPLLERVIRGMHGASWAYIVQAHPRPRSKVIEDRMKSIDLLTQITSRSRVQWQSTQQESQQFTTTSSGGQTQTYSGDLVNYRAQYLIRLLERDLERIDQAAATGQWIVRTCFGAAQAHDARRLASLLLGTLAGTDSRPEPLRASLCQPNGLPLEAFSTFLTSEEVATLIQFPREEVPGYTIQDYVRFDVDFRAPEDMTLPLGHIQQNGRDMPGTFNISLDALAKHAVVIGVTGSGKTTTVMGLLDRVIEAGKSFLVIEPAKTEYRALRSALAPRSELRVYTLGNETVAPFRLNPFEFETDDEPGSVSLLTHIDFLKAVFNAAFILYAPMPHVLEEALHEVYEDKGWDIASGINRRVQDWSQRHRYPIFPTLTDLYRKVEIVTERLGYHDEVERNVKAGLKARIGSLRIGSKGLMLDTARGIPMQDLLSKPTILEMENIGNDDEKTFLMGLFLAKLYEYRRLQAATGQQPAGLQNLLVIEEAHRLLQNTSTYVDVESANPRAQAIEVFTNMLSEMRAYGQGVLVAEQIPSKLAPDVLKNTNLKIVHRLIAYDDRRSIGHTMNLNQEQQTYLGILTPGMAAVYAEGADHAYLVRMENYKRRLAPLIDAQLKFISREYASVAPFQAIPDLTEYDLPRTPSGGPDPLIFQTAGKLLDAESCRWLWAQLLLRMLSSPAHVYETLVRFSDLIEAEMPHLPPGEHDAILRMLMVRGSMQLMHERGAQFGWSYARVEELRVPLTRGLLGLLHGYDLARTSTDLDPEELMSRVQQAVAKASQPLDEFTDSYERFMQRRQGPFTGCLHCPAKCLYRAEVHTLLSSRDQQWLDSELSGMTPGTNEERYAALAQATMRLAQNWLGGEEENEALPAISYCTALHLVDRQKLTEYEQVTAGTHLKSAILDQS
jgi:hypothetical protein